MNDDETKFYVSYKVMSHDTIMEDVVEDGAATVTDDHGSFTLDDAQTLYDDAMDCSDEWMPVRR